MSSETEMRAANQSLYLCYVFHSMIGAKVCRVKYDTMCERLISFDLVFDLLSFSPSELAGSIHTTAVRILAGCLLFVQLLYTLSCTNNDIPVVYE